MIYAGFWKRVTAFLIDWALVTGATSLTYVFILFVFIFTSPDYNVALQNVTYTMAQKPYLTPLLNTVILWLYYAGFEASSRQATPGKLVMKLRVCRTDGSAIGFGRASARYFSKYLSGLILMIGYLMAAFTRKKQALHDKMAGCVILGTSAPMDKEAPAQSEPVEAFSA